jgi:hypothetical protein
MSVDREREGNTPTGPVEIEGAMETGQGADDEPEMTIGDKYGDEADDSETGEPGTLRVEEAAELLGANEAEPKREEA